MASELALPSPPTMAVAGELGGGGGGDGGGGAGGGAGGGGAAGGGGGRIFSPAKCANRSGATRVRYGGSP